MTIQGVRHLYIETHNWGKSVAFWKQLGFELEFETDHHSGSLVAPNGSRIFVSEQSPEDPLGDRHLPRRRRRRELPAGATGRGRAAVHGDALGHPGDDRP